MRGGNCDSDDNGSNGVIGREGGGGGGSGGEGVAEVWYVRISMRSNLTDQYIFLGKYSREAGSILETMVLRQKGLNLYSPGGSSATYMMNIEKRGWNNGLSLDRFRDNLISLAYLYRGSVQFLEQED